MADGDDDDILTIALTAAGWGTFSAVSLLIGAAVGILKNPPKTVRAILMAYGSGALIEALSIELFAHIVHMAEAKPVLSCPGTSGSSGGRLLGHASYHRRLASGEGEGPGKKLVYLAMAMGLFGGLVFAGLNKVLNDAGGWARKASTLKDQIGRRRLIFYSSLAKKLQQVPMFGECLDFQELRELASKMRKDIFEEGEVLFHDAEAHSPIYFLLSGDVRVEIFSTEVKEKRPHGSPSSGPLAVSPYCSENPDLKALAKGAWKQPGYPSGVLFVAEETNGDSLSIPNCYPEALKKSVQGLDALEVDYDSEQSDDEEDEDIVDSYMVHKHQLFGEVALFTGQPTGAQAVAVTQCTALKLLTNDFIDLCYSNHRMTMFLSKSAAQGMSRAPLFVGCGEETMVKVLGEMTESVFAAEEQIYDVADSDTPLYYLVLGKVELTYAADGDKPGQKCIVRPTSLFGTDHLINGEQIKVSAVALDRSLAMRVDRSFIDKLSKDLPHLEKSIAKVRQTTKLNSHLSHQALMLASSDTHTRGDALAEGLVHGDVDADPEAKSDLGLGHGRRASISLGMGAPQMGHMKSLHNALGWQELSTTRLNFKPEASNSEASPGLKVQQSSGLGRSNIRRSSGDMSTSSEDSIVAIAPPPRRRISIMCEEKGRRVGAMPLQTISSDPEEDYQMDDDGDTPKKPAKKVSVRNERSSTTSSSSRVSGSKTTRSSANLQSEESFTVGAHANLSQAWGPGGSGDVDPNHLSVSAGIGSTGTGSSSHLTVGRTLSLTKAPGKDLRRISSVSLPEDGLIGDDLCSAKPEVSDAEVFERIAEPGDEGGHGGHENAHAAMMIWLGIFIDAIPESVVLGILSSTSSTSSLITFVIGVFLSNLPEAMSSSATMFACGIPKGRIMIMWASIVVLTGIGASVGAVAFYGKDETEPAQMAIAAIEGMCGGAMLAMIANTALPEAFEQGGDVVGLSCLSGFLSALFVGVVSS